MRDGDWYGSAVNVAARLADMAEPNEAVVSDATQAIADDDARSVLRCRGEVGLRGVARPVVVWRMGERGPEPPARLSEGRGSALLPPAQDATVIGAPSREAIGVEVLEQGVGEPA
jgi:hypothetical protein